MELVDLIVMSNQSAQWMRDVAQLVYACMTDKSSRIEY